MWHDQYCLHGVSLSLATDSVTLADTVKIYLYSFQQPVLGAPPDFKMTLNDVHDWAEIPIGLSPAAQLLSFHHEKPADDLPHTDWPCDLYRDGNVKIADLHDHGLIRIDDRQGCVDGYVVNPSALHRDVCTAIFHFVLTELLKRKGMYAIHATALEKGGRGFLMPGQSGRGKTTCCIALLRSGYRFLADDHPFVRATNTGLELLSFPEKIDVTDTTVAFFPELQQANGYLHQGLYKRYFYAGDLYPSEKIDSCKPAFIILPHVADCLHSHLEPLAKGQVLEELLPQSLLVFDKEVAQQQFQTLSRLVQQADCYRLYCGQDVLKLPELIDTLLDVT